MFKKPAVFSAVLIGGILVACSSHGSGGNFMPGGGGMTLPAVDSDLMITSNVPARTIGEELPSAGLGTVASSFWKATLGGYTQTKYSQALGFPPGTKITIRNLSNKIPHTLDVVEKITQRPAKFPKNPKLKTDAQGHGVLAAGYASGIIEPGKSVTVTLSSPGIYLIGCAFHYGEGMRDVLVVGKKAKPGQQATPPPKDTPRPSSSPSSHPTPSGY